MTNKMNFSNRLLLGALSATVIVANLIAPVSALYAPKPTISNAGQSQNFDQPNILNINTLKDPALNSSTIYKQNVLLGKGRYTYTVKLKKYNSSSTSLNTLFNVICAQQTCNVNGETLTRGQQVRYSAIVMPSSFESNVWKTFTTRFTITNPNMQVFQVQINAQAADELDVKEITLKQTKPNGTTTQLINNDKFSNSTNYDQSYYQARGWGAGLDNWGFKFTDVQAYHPEANGSVFVVNSSTRVDNQYVRFEVPVTLNAGDTYNFDFKAKAGVVKGRGVKIALSCAQADGCGHLANNQDLINYNVPVSNTFVTNVTNGFMVPENGQYFVRIYVNDGSEAIFDHVRLKSWHNAGQTINWNSDFDFATLTTKPMAQPSNWQNFGTTMGQVAAIKR